VAKALGGEGQRRLDHSGAPIAPGRVGFLNDSRAGHHFHYSSDWPASDFSGTGFFQVRATRSSFYDRAGRRKIECEGFLQDGEGAGCFTFAAEPRYRRKMKSLVAKGSTATNNGAMAIQRCQSEIPPGTSSWKIARDWIRTSSSLSRFMV